MWVGKQIATWIGYFLLAECAVGQVSPTIFGTREARGNIENPEINEASGLVAAVGHTGHFWTHNDSGDGARIFLIDGSAHHKATYYLQGISAYDWEDIAMMERDGCHYLLIGDIGDNRGQRPYVHLHVLKEPTAPIRTPMVDTLPNEQVRSFVLRYEDGPRDAESLFFDPLDEQLYVISKRELEVGIYATALPEIPGDTLMLRKVGVLPHTFITSAAISPDGTEMLLKNLLQVFYWKRKPGESIAEMSSRPAMLQPYQPEPQGEAVAFAPDGQGYYTLGEAVLGMQSVLYFYPRY
ncbi:hypothetical protein [Parapedobacter sp. 2B3]|uniref:hypothetical protein n=1 Tax=Parapedobacter sp. 2B3 TaxID=3342381 RepID=UPI0035B585A5